MKIWRGQPDNWTPSDKDKGRVWLGLSLVSFALGAYAYFHPSSSSLTGRWGWLHRIFFDAFGSSGDIVLHCLFGAAALTAGISYLSKKEEAK